MASRSGGGSTVRGAAGGDWVTGGRMAGVWCLVVEQQRTFPLQIAGPPGARLRNAWWR